MLGGGRLQMAGQEVDDRRDEAELAFRAGDLVTLIREEHQLRFHPAFEGCGDGLLGLADRNVAVVGAVDGQQGGLQPVKAAERGEIGQQISVGTRVAILRGGYGGDPGFGVLVEGLQVRHAAHVDTSREELRVESQRGQGQVAAVGAAHAGQPTGLGHADA